MLGDYLVNTFSRDTYGVSSGVTRIAIALVEHQNRFVVGVRPEGPELAGLHEFPGGKVRHLETPSEAALRECLEETGLEVQLLQGEGVVRHRYEHADLELHFFRCRPFDGTARPSPPFEWILRGDLANCRFPAANAEIVARLLRS